MGLPLLTPYAAMNFHRDPLNTALLHFAWMLDL